MTPSLLREIGEALYGPLWQSEMARQRGVSVRTVQRWDAGDNAIPDGIWPELANAIRERRTGLQGLLRKLPR